MCILKVKNNLLVLFQTIIKKLHLNYNLNYDETNNFKHFPTLAKHIRRIVRNIQFYFSFYRKIWTPFQSAFLRKNGKSFALFEIPFVVEITLAMKAKFQTGYIEFDQFEEKYDQPSLTYIFKNTCILDTRYLVFHNHVCIIYYSLFGNIHICEVVFKNEKQPTEESNYCFEYTFWKLFENYHNISIGSLMFTWKT